MPNDLFTEGDRAKLNAAMESGSGSRYAALLLEQPHPSGVTKWVARAGFVILGLLLGIMLTALIGPLGLIGLVILVVLGVFASGRIAGWFHRRGLVGRARKEVVGGYAEQRGWQMVETISLAATTPLLRDGDRRKTGWGVHGSFDATTQFSAGFYEYETRETRTDSEGNSSEYWEQHPFTVALITAPLADLKQLSIAKGSTGGIFSKISGAVSSLRPVPLESEEFNKQFQLMVADEAAEIAIRLRFTPAVQVALIERGAGTSRAEAENGVLMVARVGEPKTDDFGTLMDILGDALWMRAVLTDDPPGRVPNVEVLRVLLLGE